MKLVGFFSDNLRQRRAILGRDTVFFSWKSVRLYLYKRHEMETASLVEAEVVRRPDIIFYGGKFKKSLRNLKVEE